MEEKERKNEVIDGEGEVIETNGETAAEQQETEPATETVTEIETETKAAEPSNADVFRERITTARNLGETDDEGMFKEALEYMTELENEAKSAKQFRDDIITILRENPEISVVMKRTQETGDFVGAILELVDDIDDLRLKEGEEGYEEMKHKIAERARNEALQNDIASRWEANKTDLPTAVSAFVSEKGLSEENADDFINFIATLAQRVIVGDIDGTVLSQLYKSYVYDEMLTKAEEDMNILKGNTASEKKEVPTVPMPQNTAVSPQSKEDGGSPSLRNLFNY